MSQVSSKLRSVQGGFSHWCPGCEEMHVLPDSWSFNGDLESPSFTPSFKHEGVRCVYENGKWTGEWQRDEDGNLVRYVCHYTLTAGVLNFHTDSTHSLAGQAVFLPTLPDWLRD